MNSLILFRILLLFIICTPSSYGEKCSIHLKLPLLMTATGMCRKISVRNMFQCNSACQMDSTCRSAQYDYRTRICELSKFDYSSDIENDKLEDLLESSCRSDDFGSCSDDVCSHENQCVHAAETYLCLKKACKDTVVDCGFPYSIPNGNVTVNATTFGSIGQVVCNTGFNFSSVNDTVSCTSDGQWQPITGSCIAVDCGFPYSIPNGNVTVNATTFGSVGHVVCSTGFNYSSANDTVSCISDGQWEQISGSCNVVDCGVPNHIPNGDVTVNETTFGSIGQVVCNTGFYYSSVNDTVSCTSDGQWEPITGSCNEINCGLPPEMSNSNTTYISTNFGSLAEIVCNNGYKYSSVNTTLTCEADGEWQGVQSTESCLRDCGHPPSISHGYANYSTTTAGSTYLVVCDNGYKFPDVTNTSTCTSMGVWEPIKSYCVTDLVYIEDWILVFRAAADNMQPIYSTWMNDALYNDHPVDPNNLQPGCITLTTSLPCNIHFKSKLVTKWETADIKTVKYLLLKNNEIRSEILFDGLGTTKTSWFSKDRVINSTWTDLKTSTFNYFSVIGHPNTRRFFINNEYHGCPDDYSWTVVIDGNDASHLCSWDNPSTYPKFIYTTKSTKTITGNLEDFEYGDALAVLVKVKI